MDGLYILQPSKPVMGGKNTKRRLRENKKSKTNHKSKSQSKNRKSRKYFRKK